MLKNVIKYILIVLLKIELSCIKILGFYFVVKKC